MNPPDSDLSTAAGHAKPAAPAGNGSGDTRTVTRGEFLQLFAAIMLPMFMAISDQTLLATATPAIAADFGQLYDTAWIATAYMLTSVVMIPIYGRLGDRYGRLHMLKIALAIFVLGSLSCAMSQSMPQLIAGRIFQALGGGGLMMLSFALIGELVPPRQRAHYQAYLAIVSTAANVASPIIGGLVVGHASWRWLFLANLPLGLIAGWRMTCLPRGAVNPDAPGVSDTLGLALFVVGTVSLLFGISSAGHRFEWLSWQTALCAATGVVCWAWLLAHEARHRAPFFPLELLKIPGVGLFCASALANTFCLLSVVFYLPVYLQLGLHTGAGNSGLLLAPVMAGFILGGALPARYVSHSGDPKPIPVIGQGLAALGFVALAFAPPNLAVVGTLGFITGVGLGGTMPIVQVCVQTMAGYAHLGVATSLTSLSRTVGATLGTSLIGALIYSLIPDLAQLRLDLAAPQVAGAPPNAEVLHAFRVAFLCTALVAATGSTIASRAPRLRL